VVDPPTVKDGGEMTSATAVIPWTAMVRGAEVAVVVSGDAVAAAGEMRCRPRSRGVSGDAV